MKEPTSYRDKAWQCRSLARLTKTQELRAYLNDTAKAFDSAAEDAEVLRQMKDRLAQYRAFAKRLRPR